ncbi:N-acetylmuramoyl-L-alanine amidase [Saccharomonospora sp. NPDC046836]|uniref:peptidoglycan recognition protein family protein n=1 Tax=Saccharomonospora sp. NPDC046836 TaxID=3156921 RepID=UPI0033FC1560
MGSRTGFNRRALIRGGLAVTAVGALSAVPVGIAGAATRRAPEPVIYRTSDWGARAPRAPIEVLNRKPTYIVVHHTVEPGNSTNYSRQRALQISRDIQNFHMDTRGWIDSGQQFTISRGGYITEGRHRSYEALRSGNRHVMGANVGNHNSEVIGIENEGLYTSVDVPEAQWESLVRMVAYIASQYGIAPEFIRGHRDFMTTQCPGDMLYARLPELREAVGAELDLPVREAATWPLLRPGDTGENVRIAQQLLREQGNDLAVDGVFGPRTRDAVATFAAANGVQAAACSGAAHADERGLLGADIWPLLATGTGRHDLSARLVKSV